MQNRVGWISKPALASRSCSLRVDGGQAAYLLVGPRQLLFQGGNALQGCSEPLPHLPKVKGDGGRNRNPTGLRLEEPGLDLPALGMRQREGSSEMQMSEREPKRR